MKKNIIRIILSILLLCTFVLIFGFSSQDGEKSGGISQKITQVITSNINSIQELEKIEKEEVLNKIEYVVRKLAHFSIYAVVGILLMGLLCTYEIENNKRILITVIVGMLYAVSDEIHQGFIPGRSPQFTDVLIDTFGVITGALCSMIILKKRKIYEKKKNST